MTLERAARLAAAGLCASVLVALPALAEAQVGSLMGKAVGPDGKPVADAEVTLTAPAGGLTVVTKTNSNGEFTRAGLMTQQPWNVRIKKGNLEGGINGVRVPFNNVLELPPIVMTVAAPPLDAAAKARLEAERAMKETLTKMGAQLDAAIAAGNLDEAINLFMEAAKTVPNCGVCYARAGDLYVKQDKLAEAEKAYLESIKLDPENTEPYSALANIYNSQRKFAEAAKMTEKVASLSGKQGGGDNAEALFNQGAIAFNQNKIAEAKPFLQKALALKPDLAEAHYLYGMVLINEGNVAEAKKSLAEYLKLAPNGPNAATAKAIIDTP
jgi:tetratricopeptide (TPR) repeat protein